MVSRAKTVASKQPNAVALKDAFSAFINAYKSRMKTVLAEISSGESSSRVMVVVVLRKHGALPMGSIATYVGLPKSNITALVDDLEGEGVLRRRRDEADRRVTYVELTAKGRALGAKEYDAYEQSLAAIFDALPKTEREAMLSGFQRMTSVLRADISARSTDETAQTGDFRAKSTGKKNRLRVR